MDPVPPHVLVPGPRTFVKTLQGFESGSMQVRANMPISMRREDDHDSRLVQLALQNAQSNPFYLPLFGQKCRTWCV